MRTIVFIDNHTKKTIYKLDFDSPEGRFLYPYIFSFACLSNIRINKNADHKFKGDRISLLLTTYKDAYNSASKLVDNVISGEIEDITIQRVLRVSNYFTNVLEDILSKNASVTMSVMYLSSVVMSAIKSIYSLSLNGVCSVEDVIKLFDSKKDMGKLLNELAQAKLIEIVKNDTDFYKSRITITRRGIELI